MIRSNETNHPSLVGRTDENGLSDGSVDVAAAEYAASSLDMDKLFRVNKGAET